jgi:protein SCO1/2
LRTSSPIAAIVASATLAGGCARHYTSQGLVVRVDRPGATITISHDAFPGYMDAMVMPFELRGRARAVSVSRGDRVSLRLAVRGGRSWIDRLDVVSAAPVDAGLQTTPAVPVLVPVGGTVPDFELTDQAGGTQSLSALRGKVVVVNFIYSRCPLPDYCPRMVANFRAVRDRFAERMNRDLVLLTVSFDPQYDTPERLGDYASAQRAGGPGWYFLTGDPARIERVCASFGIQYFPEEGLITHSLQTAVIDRTGRLAATVEGKDFSGRQLGDLIASVLGG